MSHKHALLIMHDNSHLLTVSHSFNSSKNWIIETQWLNKVILQKVN